MQDGDLPIEDQIEEDAFQLRMIEEENAMLNPDERGIYLMPIFKKRLDPPMGPDQLDEANIRYYLTHAVHLLAEHHFCLTNSNHLSDRQLYQHILDEILPKPVGVGPNPVGGILYHECCPGTGCPALPPGWPL